MQTLTAYSVKIFGINLNFDSVAFTLPIGDGWDIYWYGICIAAAFLAAVVYGFTHAKKFGIDPDRLTDVVLVTTPLSILLARVYYIIFYPGGLEINSVGEFFGISGSSGMSGLAIYGGVIGAVTVGALMCWIRKVNVLDAFDLTFICFPLAQAIGRWGNFFNQEAFGSLTTAPGMMSDGVLGYIQMNMGEFFTGQRPADVAQYVSDNGLSVHPCFFYESLWCILGFVLLHFLSKKRKFKGQIALTYGVWYGFGRMIIEGLRTDSLYLGPLKVSQWLSGALVLGCGIVLVVMLIRLKNAKEALTYESLFDDIDDTTVKTVYYEGDEETLEESEGETAEDFADETEKDTESESETQTETKIESVEVTDQEKTAKDEE